MLDSPASENDHVVGSGEIGGVCIHVGGGDEKVRR